MGEALSCGLAQTGFPVYKLVPTGTVDEVTNSWTLADLSKFLDKLILPFPQSKLRSVLKCDLMNSALSFFSPSNKRGRDIQVLL